MDPVAPLPIVVEHHDLPAPLATDRVRRRGQGYQVVAAPLPPPVPQPNRAERRRAARTTAVRAGRLAPLAALLLAPVALAVTTAAAPAAAGADTTAAGDGAPTSGPAPSTATSTGTSTVTSTGTSTVTSTGTSTVTVSGTNAPATSAPATTAPATTNATPATTAPRTTTGGTVRTPPGTIAPASTTTARPTATTKAPTRATIVPAADVTAPTTTSTPSPTVPGASVAPTVGAVVLPPDAPAGADPVAAAASQALTARHDLAAAERRADDLTDASQAADVETGRLESRVAALTADAFDLARAGRPTAEVELARSAAQSDLDAARAEGAALALRLAAATTERDDLAARYPAARLLLAALVAVPAGVAPSALDAAWAAAPDARVDVVYAALAQVGDPYVWAATGPDTFDCSGLTAFAWRAAGVELAHYTVTQRQTVLDVAEAALAPGDLVFNLDGPNGGHVQLYLGVGKLVVHAPAPGRTVSVTEYHTVTGFGSPLAG